MVFPNICQWMHFTCQRLFTTPITFHSPMEKVAIIFKSITYLDFYFKRQYHPQLDISKDEKDAQHEHEFFRVLYLFQLWAPCMPFITDISDPDLADWFHIRIHFPRLQCSPKIQIHNSKNRKPLECSDIYIYRQYDISKHDINHKRYVRQQYHLYKCKHIDYKTC